MRDGTSGATGALQCRDPMYVQLGAVAEVAARLQPDCVHLPWSSRCAMGSLGMGGSCRSLYKGLAIAVASVHCSLYRARGKLLRPLRLHSVTH